MYEFDVIIIGVGQAGNPLCSKLTEQGLSVAIVEKEHAGGSCINYGCTPTKAMLASAHVASVVQKSKEWGITTKSSKVNFKKVLKRRDNIVKNWRKGIKTRIEENSQAKFIKGEAQFVSSDTIDIISGKDKGTQLKAPKIFINVGTQPTIPTIAGLDSINYYTAKTIMKLAERPKHLIILGGSYIGLEYAQMYRQLGSKVTVIHDKPQLAPREDEDIALKLHELLLNEGCQLFLKAETKEAVKHKQGFKLKVEVSGKGELWLKGSHLLLATGTTPNTQSLNLEAAGIKTNEEGYIEVNTKLATSAEGIWALGDCKGGPEFTHISYNDYRIVEDQLFGDQKLTTRNRMVPYTLYTQPELGRIGLSEKEAKEEGLEFKVAKIAAEEVGRTELEGHTFGILKVIVDATNNRILGGACLIDRGGEMAAMLQIAMMGKLTYQQLRDGIFAHPGYAEAWNTLFMKLDED